MDEVEFKLFPAFAGNFAERYVMFPKIPEVVAENRMFIEGFSPGLEK